ncbi:stress responsive A/B barrel domain protein [Aspergillus germanicus]
MFMFRPDVGAQTKDTFLRELRKLKDLESVKAQRLVVGGPSLTDPIERSKGFELAIMSLHNDLADLERYQASQEHHWVTTTYLWPYKEDVVRFDFEVAPEDEWMWNFNDLAATPAIERGA